jgi:hypothetical protein
VISVAAVLPLLLPLLLLLLLLLLGCVPSSAVAR